MVYNTTLFQEKIVGFDVFDVIRDSYLRQTSSFPIFSGCKEGSATIFEDMNAIPTLHEPISE